MIEKDPYLFSLKYFREEKVYTDCYNIKEVIQMFLSAFIESAVKFVVYAAIVVAGFIAGAKYHDSKKGAK